MDPITLEVIKNAFIAISEEMGVALKRTAFSANIKERNDFSCAIFDSKGRMISQAEHLPVHLGSMIFSVKQALEDIPYVDEGDVLILNDPYRGGTHLPDITLISPIYYNNTLVGYSCNRAHHADIGGATPGSMAAYATDVHQEGLIIPPIKLYSKGKEVQDVFKLILHNVRTPEERLGDLRAQVSANKIGIKRLNELIQKYGLYKIKEYMSAILDYSEKRTRYEISKIPKETYEFTDYMESDGIEERDFKIHAKIEVKDTEMIFDFSNTDKQAKGPINAVYPVTVSAVYYVLRCLTDPSIPPNSGHYRPLEIIAPEGTLVNPKPPAPVAGGNVETSQRIVDVLLGALAKAVPNKVIAACNGSMHNITLGGVDPILGVYAYYETIGGGFGARPNKDGISAVHCHMTNTQNTPIEALEQILPIQIEKYAIRKNSGGIGKYRGGNGIEKQIKLLRGDAKLSILAERHRLKPYGLFGGGEGKNGEVYIVRTTEKIKLKSKGTYDLHKDDVLCIKTAGGGGYGRV